MEMPYYSAKSYGFLRVIVGTRSNSVIGFPSMEFLDKTGYDLEDHQDIGT